MVPIAHIVRVYGAFSGSGFGDGFPRSGTPPPSLRGPESGCELGVGSPREDGTTFEGDR
ncbi:hypothetical protein HanRHA438_Chr09g0416161 [Helianthus annuus]|nr:hypothetical protein HanRHA438_Chr09g0416161 [Helianthus annuus]